MKHFITLLLLSFSLSAISQEKEKYYQLGFAEIKIGYPMAYFFDNREAFLSGDVDTTIIQQYYANAIQEAATALGKRRFGDIKIYIDYDNADREEIKKICSTYELDGLLVGYMKFMSSNTDVLVRLALYDEDGIEVTKAKHNTFTGNSYFLVPAYDRTIADATKGALRKIYANLNKIYKKEQK